jgi:hypothetical protein
MSSTAESVSAARSAAATLGWDLTWVVVADGPAPLPEIDWPQGTILRSLPVHGGTAAARNRGLTGCPPGWVLPLDADDTIDAEGLVEVLADRATLDQVGWVACNRVLTDGTRTPHWIETPVRWPAGTLEKRWECPFPFHPNSLLARRDLVFAAGGWPATIVNEDLGLCLRLSTLAPGAALTPVVIRYRSRDEQSVAASWYEEAKASAFDFLGAVVNAGRAHRGLVPVEIPAAGPSHGTQRRSGCPHRSTQDLQIDVGNANSDCLRRMSADTLAASEKSGDVPSTARPACVAELLRALAGHLVSVQQ